LLRQGKAPIYEHGLNELLGQVTSRFVVTADTAEAVADADVVLIAVGTPPKANGEADTSHVETAAREIAHGLRAGRTYVVAVKSTVPIGTYRRVKYVIQTTLA